MLRQPMADIELNDADRAILDTLHEGRNLPANIANEAEYTRQYVSTRLKRLREHGIVENLGRGLYEVVEDEVPPSYYEDIDE